MGSDNGSPPVSFCVSPSTVVIGTFVSFVNGTEGGSSVFPSDWSLSARLDRDEADDDERLLLLPLLLLLLPLLPLDEEEEERERRRRFDR
jgi:hypothetical protein